MKRKRRTEILIRSKNNLAKMLSDEINNKYNVEIIEDSNHGLVMIKKRDTAKKELFYLGEVLVTETKVAINGKIGLGIVIGDNEELSKDLAIIDAAYNSNLQEVGSWENKLINEEKKINAYENEITKRIMKTKVDFKTMDV
ncbi:MAG: phosphonate C-P lyase system protein PhnG [Clostridiales bacterium]|nr:phosphonate C-P lyase system protein PhnG [Clostridiales bacterium]